MLVLKIIALSISFEISISLMIIGNENHWRKMTYAGILLFISSIVLLVM